MSLDALATPTEQACIEQFRTAIQAAGLEPPDDIQADGTLHRFPSNGRRGDDSGWYCLHGDGIPAGTFGCWRSGLTQTWCSKSQDAMTQAERDAHQRRVQAMRTQREADLAQRQQHAAKLAGARWEAARPAAEHPYLKAKGVKAHGLRLEGEGLLVPMRDTAGTLHSLQVIDPEGGKRFQPGGRVKGCYHSFGKPGRVLVVAEGYATGSSIHEATGHAVAVAFNAGNVRAVAEALHQKYPALKIILAADDDHRTEGNPGLTKAREAAQAVGGLLAVPKFPEGRGEKDTDFNDLHRLAGLEAVKSCIEGAQAGADDAAWPEPQPLPEALPPVQPFDPDLLPESLRGWVLDIAHRMQCPPDFPAVGVLVALSSLVGARAVIHPKAKDDWAVVPNLWGLIVGRPGVMKSPALGQAMAPLHRLEAEARELAQEARKAWEIDCKVAELATRTNERQAAAAAAKDPDKARALLQPVDTPAEPTARRYVVNDSSVEKLADLLTTNPWGLMVYRDELHGLLCSMDRPGQEGARGFYLTAYDGNQGYAVDRIGRGESYATRVCLAMLGGTQPGKAQSYVREAVAGGAADDGLLQRFGLTVWPDVNRAFTYVDQWPDGQAKQMAWAVFERLNALQPATDEDAHQWRFTPEAQAIFEQWVIGFETEIRGDDLHPALVSHLAKYRKLVPALALIFALVDTPDSGNLVDRCELVRSLAMADYLRTHAERLYASATIPETSAAKALLTKIKGLKLCNADGVPLEAFTPRQVAVKSWSGLSTPAEVRKAAELLADYGWLARETVQSGDAMGRGRPSERYLVHPALFRGGQS